MQDDSDKMLAFELEQMAQGGPLAFNKATILEAIDRLSALQAKLDSVTKDAERYRFLQCSPSWRIQVIRQNGAGTWEWVSPRFGYGMDEDIDEARKALTDQGRAGEAT